MNLNIILPISIKEPKKKKPQQPQNHSTENANDRAGATRQDLLQFFLNYCLELK